jgi:hypothetical protein
MRRWILLWLSASVLFLLLGCENVKIIYTLTATPSATRPPTRAPVSTATPTIVFLVPGDVTGTATPTPTPTPTSTSPGALTLSGTTESFTQVDKVFQLPLSGTAQDIIQKTAQFTLTTVEGHRLRGTVQVTVRTQKQADWVDPEGVDHNCKLDWDSGPVTWTAELEGDYQQQPDGSLMVNFDATPATGPAYTEPVCGLPDTTVTPLWPGSGGVLQNGVYDARVDRPVVTTTDGVTSWGYDKVHIEQSRP